MFARLRAIKRDVILWGAVIAVVCAIGPFLPESEHPRQRPYATPQGMVKLDPSEPIVIRERNGR